MENEHIKITIFEMETLRKGAISGLNERLISMEKSKLYCLAMFCDPRFKHNFASDPRLFIIQVSNWIKEEISTTSDEFKIFNILKVKYTFINFFEKFEKIQIRSGIRVNSAGLRKLLFTGLKPDRINPEKSGRTLSGMSMKSKIRFPGPEK